MCEPTLNFPLTRPDSSPLQNGDQYVGNGGVIYTYENGVWTGVNPVVSYGFTGSQGASGYTGSIGAGLVFQGDWQEIPHTYVGGQDIVSFGGSTYIKIGDGNSGSYPPDDNAIWQLFTAQGGPGYTGSQGEQGSTGYTGSFGCIGYTGSQGPQGPAGGYTGSVGYTGSAATGILNYTQVQGAVSTVSNTSAFPFTLVSATIVTAGSPVQIVAFGDMKSKGGFAGAPGAYLQLYRDGIAIGPSLLVAGDSQNSVPNYAINYIDSTATAASHVYSLAIPSSASVSANPGETFGFNSSPIISVTEMANVLGYTGSAGACGSQGYMGSQGYDGSAGFTGSAGAIGFVGSAGTNGFTGSTGVGFTGSSGTNGYTGSAGSSGSNGYTGSAGTSGSATTSTLTAGTYTVVLSTTGTITAPGRITTPVGSNASIILDPDGLADVIVTTATQILMWATNTSISTTTGALIVTGGVGVGGTVTANKFAGDGSSLTNVTVSQAGNIVGVQPNVTLVAGSYSYLFDNTGTFTMPANGDIVMTGVNSILSVSGTTLLGGASQVVGYYSTLGISYPGGGTQYGMTLRPAADNTTAISFLNAAGTRIGSITQTTSTVTFTGDGSQLTGVATRTTGSWTVAIGTGTYSITVPQSGTYQIWVRGNIPNGIIAYIATAVVTNSNVPVVGNQYAWVYNGGGTPIDFTSIPNQFTGTAGTIVRSSTAPSATTNRFDFGISNTSTSTQIVYWGYVTL